MLLCRRLQLLINGLKQSKDKELERHNLAEECCSETDTEGNDHLSERRSNARCSPDASNWNYSISNSGASGEEPSDDVPLISFFGSCKNSTKNKSVQLKKHNNHSQTIKMSPKSLSKSTNNQQPVVGRKRVRVILSDDDSELPDEVECSKGTPDKCPVQFVATSDDWVLVIMWFAL